MSERYGREYYEQYCSGEDKVSYEEAGKIQEFLKSAAKKIADDLHPATVLDAGCAMGYLVAALRDCGVEAYGVDISEYAISRVREDIRPYCAAGSLANPLPENFPKRFDLIISIEVLEHLYEVDGKAAIENFGRLSDCVIFCSSPDIFDETKRVNVQQREYWARLFASEGFYDDLSYRPLYLADYAVCYRRRADWLQQVEDYERNIRIMDERYKEITRYKNNCLKAVSQLAEARNAYSEISNSVFWKATKPLRAAAALAERLMQSNRYTKLFYKGLKSLKNNGVRFTWRKVKHKLRYSRELRALTARPLYTQEELEAQRTCVFPRAVKFSIVVPVYNTPQKFLHEMIRSVLDQTYGDWELCMADGSDQEHAYVGQICQEYAGQDKRIIYRKLEANKGISENTNACIDMASGDYIGLLDHDDLLHPAALYDVMRAICEQDADLVYTDEMIFESPNVKKIVTVHFKPDFAIDNLRGNNYICHFSVFGKTLLDSAGRFRSAYDGSQDHDMILRLTAHAKKIVHIPKLLYYWRSHPQSVAMDISSKGYAAAAGKNAVLDSVAQLGIQAVVEHSKAFPAIYRLRYAIQDSAKVSIIITVDGYTDELKHCIDFILMRSTYPNYEIIVVDSGSDESDGLAYFNSLKADGRVKRVHSDTEHNDAGLYEIGALKATGEYFIFLHPDTEVITPEWIEEMLMYVQRDDVAAAGAMLYFPDDLIQHAGIVLSTSMDRIVGNLCYCVPRGDTGYMGRLCYAQSLSAVSTACMMVKARIYQEVGGFDRDFTGIYHAADFCLKLRRAGYLIVWTPHAELYHYEPKNLRKYISAPDERLEEEILRFKDRWNDMLTAGDPYYNPNFIVFRDDFLLG